MKIALCFFGILRNYDLVRESILRNLINQLKTRGTLSIFANFNAPEMIINQRSSENGKIDVLAYEKFTSDTNCIPLLTQQKDCDLKLDFKQIENIKDAWDDNHVSTRNMLRQLYSLNMVVAQLKENYDVVICARADVKYLTKVRIKQPKENVIYTPVFADRYGANDRFAYGSMNVMKSYAQRQNYVEHYIKRHKRLASESFLYEYLKELKIKIKFEYILFVRIRLTGSVAQYC